MAHYADTSFLVSYYGQDANSAAALSALSARRVPLSFTALHHLELRNAFELAVQRGIMTSGGARLVWAVVLGDVRSRRLLRPAVDWRSAWRRAAQLSGRHTQRLGTRSFDILHVAVAQNLGAREFFSFDHRQRQLAAAEGSGGVAVARAGSPPILHLPSAGPLLTFAPLHALVPAQTVFGPPL